jgi:DNA-binding SARP family transcriptional activator
VVVDEPEPPKAATVPRLRIALLGPLRAWHSGAEVDLGPVRQQALLAALMLPSDVTVSQRELLERVWGLETPEGNVIQVYVYRLRKRLQTVDDAVDPVIMRDRGGYRFVTDGVWLDTVRLEELAEEAGAAERAGDLAAAVDICSRALDLFQGEPLAGLPGPFAAGERIRLAERRIALFLRNWSGGCALARTPRSWPSCPR